MSVFYINGSYVEETDASLAARDLSILRGYGVFDFLRTYGGNPFRLHKNIARMRRSCEIIELEFPWSDDDLTEIVHETLRRNESETGEFSIRMVVTGGLSSNNITPDGTPSLLVLVQPIHNLPEAWYREGVKLITTDTKRLYPDAKTTMYTPAIIAQRRAREAGAVEALYKDENNNVLEGTTSNLFAFVGNTLITPDTAGGHILPGITRMTVLEIAQGHYDVAVRDLPYDELLAADEVFITAANKQILPVVAIDDHTIGNGQVGEGTQHLAALFKALTQRRAAGEEI